MEQKHFYYWTTLVLFIFLSVFLISCSESGPTQPPVNFDQLNEAYDIARQMQEIRSLVVEQSGSIIAEEYFNGYDPQDLHDVRSVTKSFSSALIGIAIDKGFIESVSQTLSDYLNPAENYLEDGRGDISIHQLLTMTAGLEWFELGGNSEFNQWVTSPDQINYYLNKPFVSPPGTQFNYSDGAAHMVSVIVKEATGMSASDFADQYLFQPLGITIRPWLADNRGYNYGGVGLKITPEDMLKFGRLYLQNGVYNGQRIISSSWIELSTQNHIETNNVVPFGQNYGYYWWLTHEHSLDIYFAMGYGGQFLILVPERDTIIVATCRWWNTGGRADENWYQIISLIMNYIIPTLG
ncbi:MAG: serine hydrolase [Ignavibacteria bacterium]|jgi:CubicO group peptidase (beta-lactamase class C family)